MECQLCGIVFIFEVLFVILYNINYKWFFAWNISEPEILQNTRFLHVTGILLSSIFCILYYLDFTNKYSIFVRYNKLFLWSNRIGCGSHSACDSMSGRNFKSRFSNPCHFWRVKSIFDTRQGRLAVRYCAHLRL